MKQHKCVVLSIDQGIRSGWAVFKWGQLVISGKAINHTQRMAAMVAAQQAAETASLPLVVALEGHDQLPASMGQNTATLIGLGASRGRWQEVAEMRGVPQKRVVQIGVADWRRRVLGKQKRIKRATAKAMAVNAALALYGVRCEHDEAEAICIGASAFHHPAVGAAVPSRYRGVDWEPAIAGYAGARHGSKKVNSTSGRQKGRQGPVG